MYMESPNWLIKWIGYDYGKDFRYMHTEGIAKLFAVQSFFETCAKSILI